MAFDYDLFVIGGGSGGVRAARLAASEGGAKTAIAEMSRYGGTCVIRGCVPKKLMVFASSYREAFADAQAYGWDVTAGGFNWQAFQAKLQPELNRLESVYRKILASNGVETFDARARLADPHTVELSTGERFTAKHILLANGGHPVRPEMENADLGIVSDDIFNLPERPEKVLIVGGGFIACEFACILNGMGSHVTQFYRGAQILRGFDDEARGHVAELMCQKGVNLHVGTNILEMRREGSGIWVKSTDGKTDTYDQVLFATGRQPNTANMGLEEAGVTLGRRGEIVVDEFSQTSV